MSFVDLEAGTLRQPRPPLPVSEVAAYAVFQINTKVGALRHLGDALGTPKDTPALRARLRVTRAEAARLAKITSQKLKQAAETADDDGAGATERIDPDSMSKLAMDFQAALRDLQQVLRRIVASERHVISAAGCGTFDGQTVQQLLATESEDHDVVVNERELGILEAEQAIAQINDISIDLATLVNDEGGSADHVVCDIEGIAAETSQGAKEENSEMAETPVSRSSKPCLLMFVLGLFLFICVLMIV